MYPCKQLIQGHSSLIFCFLFPVSLANTDHEAIKFHYYENKTLATVYLCRSTVILEIVRVHNFAFIY